jgi:hypothetical protein
MKCAKPRWHPPDKKLWNTLDEREYNRTDEMLIFRDRHWPQVLLPSTKIINFPIISLSKCQLTM